MAHKPDPEKRQATEDACSEDADLWLAECSMFDAARRLQADEDAYNSACEIAARIQGLKARLRERRAQRGQ